MKNLWKRTLAAALVLCMMLLLAGCDGWNYKSGIRQYEKGNYDKAISLFEKLALTDYEDSAEMLMASRYGKGNQLYSEGKFEEAVDVFTALADYQDSAEKVKASTYGWAGQLLEGQKYVEARELYDSLGEYEDSVNQSKECGYQLGILAYEAKNYKEAAELLTPLGDYQDAEGYLNKNGWESFGIELAKEKEAVYTSESPAYTVTVKLEGQKLRVEYTYGTESDSTYLNFVLLLEQGSDKGQLTGKAKYPFLGKSVEDSASTAWNLATYEKNGTVTWDSYTNETGGIGLSQYAGQSLQRLTDGFAAVLEASGAPTTIRDFGFKGL